VDVASGNHCQGNEDEEQSSKNSIDDEQKRWVEGGSGFQNTPKERARLRLHCSVASVRHGGVVPEGRISSSPDPGVSSRKLLHCRGHEAEIPHNGRSPIYLRSILNWTDWWHAQGAPFPILLPSFAVWTSLPPLQRSL